MPFGVMFTFTPLHVHIKYDINAVCPQRSPERGVGSNLEVGAHSEGGSASITGVCGRPPSGVQGQSPWSKGQRVSGAKLLPKGTNRHV